MNELFQVPRATYRLQLNRNFTFRDAAELVPYLADLGISHCYVSPYLRARPGSLHGYDIIDHNSLNPEVGSLEDYDHFVAELHRHGMGQIADIVPNHMGVMGSDNTWWLDVLENGEASEYAEFFDIDWDPIKGELQGKVLVPILADQYGNVLESGELKLQFDCGHGEFSIFYHDNRFPIDPGQYNRILTHELEGLRDRLGAENSSLLELESIATAFSHLPGRRGLTAEQRSERTREKEVQKRRLAALCENSPEIRKFLITDVEHFNGRQDDPRSFDALHELIKAQAYRLAQWRVAADDINYRRFFDINALAALRMENEAVFTHTHRFILGLVAQGKIDGLRIDHPDGLYDPARYLQQLRASIGSGQGAEKKRTYIVVEKILTGSERLRKDWPIDGTTGYEFSSLTNGLFVDSGAADKMRRVYRSFSGNLTEYSDLVYACKKLILRVHLASELNVLANLLSRIALANRHTCDFTMNSLRSALGEIIASFPVYRTYVSCRGVSAEDRRLIEQGVAAGRKRSNAADLSVFDFIRRVLLIESNGYEPEFYKRAITRFAMKFQQVCAAIMAKGMEDTAFYRYNRLVSLNEVGGNPSKFGTSVDEFHRANQERLSCWPHSLLASSTHDSKKSEDVRARINALSEMPAEWRLRLRRWRGWNRGKKRLIDGQTAPTRNDEYLLYQILIGMWPVENPDDAGWRAFSGRIEQYMLKAVREAKEHTSWANANAEYEGALSQFVRAILERSEKNQFLADFAEFQQRTARLGVFNSLSQCLLKLTSPGVPDIYQGNELFDFSLVDPDNRRPVDYERRRRLLKELMVADAPPRVLFDRGRLARADCSSAKLWLVWKALQARSAEAPLFERGHYIPLKVSGERAEHVAAFAREFEGRAAIVVVPRLCATLLDDHFHTVCDERVWGDTRLEIPVSGVSSYHNALTGERMPVEAAGSRRFLPVGNLLRSFPVALLLNEALAA